MVSDVAKGRDPSASDAARIRKNGTRSYLSFLGSLRRDRKSGLLTVTNGSTSRMFFIEEGILRMVSASDPDDFYRGLVLTLDKIKERKLNKLLRDDQSSRTFLPELVANAGLASREGLLELLTTSATQEIIARCQKRGAAIQFSGGACNLTSLGSGVNRWHLSIDLAKLAIDTCRARSYTEEMLADVLPEKRAVLARCAQFGDAERKSSVRIDGSKELLELIDGARSVEEVVELTKLSRFDAMVALFMLLSDRIVRTIEGEELVTLADRSLKEGRADRALSLYLQAEECGVRTVDLNLTIGRAYELMGEAERAVERYLRYVSPEVIGDSPESALEILRRVLSLDRDNIEARRRVIGTLTRLGSTDDLVIEYRALARVCRASGDPGEAGAALEQVVALGRADDALFVDLTELLAPGGDKRVAGAVFRRIAAEQAGRLTPTAARRLHEHICRLEPDAIDVKVELARALEQEGRGDAARRVYGELLADPPSCRDGAPDGVTARVKFAAQRVLESEPSDLAANRFLCDLAIARQDGDESKKRLRLLADLYGQEGDLARQCEALDALWKLGEGDFDTVVSLARTQAGRGSKEVALKTLEDLAGEQLDQGLPENAILAFEEALRISPLSLAVLRSMASIWRDCGDRKRLVRTLEKVAGLADVSDESDLLASTLEEILYLDPRNADVCRRLVGVLEPLGREEEMIERLMDLAKAEDRAGNRGAATAACDWILRVVPGHAIASRLRDSIQSVSSPLLASAPDSSDQLKDRMTELEGALQQKIDDLVTRFGQHHVDPVVGQPEAVTESHLLGRQVEMSSRIRGTSPEESQSQGTSSGFGGRFDQIPDQEIQACGDSQTSGVHDREGIGSIVERLKNLKS